MWWLTSRLVQNSWLILFDKLGNGLFGVLTARTADKRHHSFFAYTWLVIIGLLVLMDVGLI